jgi:hypothetical protein
VTGAVDRPQGVASHGDVDDDEQVVRRIAQVVLHATTLADRLQLLSERGSGAEDRSSRLDRLRQAAESGRRALHTIAEDDLPDPPRSPPAAAGDQPPR